MSVVLIINLQNLTDGRYQNLPANLRLIDAIHAMAVKKNCTPGQLSIAWVGALGGKVVPLPGSTYVQLLHAFGNFH